LSGALESGDAAQVSNRSDRGRLWLWIGAVLSLFALHSEYDLPVAAWLYSIFLLRYVRLRRPAVGVAWVWLVSLVGWACWLSLTALIASGTAAVAFLILACLLTVPFLLDRLLTPHLTRRSLLLASLVFPLGRAACEYLFTLVAGFGNFGSLAATQHGNLPLLQVTSITGSYGVSFVVAWLASVVNQAWSAGFTWPAVRSLARGYLAVLVLVLAGGAIRLAWQAPVEETVRVAGITPSRAALDERRRLDRDAPVHEDLLARTDQEARAGAKIILWSESAAPVTAETRSALIDRVAALARQRGVYIEMGMEMRGDRPSNEAVMVAPDGSVAWTYHKAHPTPAEAAIGIGAGSGAVPVLSTPVARLATVICYDLDFPPLVRQAARLDTDILLVPANDWPGIMAMHSQKAVVRAIENGFSIVRQSGHGIATALDPYGRTLATSHFYATDAQTIVAYLPVRGVGTIYSAVGDVFAWLCVAALAALGALVRLELRPRAQAASSLP